MPFDPTKPVTNSPIASAEMRDQFNGLKSLIDESIPATEKGAADGVASLDSNGLLVEQVDWSHVVNEPAFVLTTGMAGGQTIVGGTGSGENLSLQSTSQATKGKITLDTVWEFHTQGGSYVHCTNTDGGLGNVISFFADKNANTGIHFRSGGKVSYGSWNTVSALDLAAAELHANAGSWSARTLSAGTTPFFCKGASSQTAPLFKCVDSTSSEQFGIGATGQIRTNQSANATTPGSVVKKLPIYDASGTLLGYIPIYDSIS